MAGHEVLGSKDHESKLIRDPTISLRKRLESVTRGAYQYLTKRNKDLQTNSSSLKQGRCIQLQAQREHPLVDAHRGQPYISNNIRTSRYTVWDFIPKQLFFQFSRIGNFYFLCVGIPQMVILSWQIDYILLQFTKYNTRRFRAFPPLDLTPPSFLYCSSCFLQYSKKASTTTAGIDSTK